MKYQNMKIWNFCASYICLFSGIPDFSQEHGSWDCQFNGENWRHHMPTCSRWFGGGLSSDWSGLVVWTCYRSIRNGRLLLPFRDKGLRPERLHTRFIAMEMALSMWNLYTVFVVVLLSQYFSRLGCSCQNRLASCEKNWSTGRRDIVKFSYLVSFHF